MSESQTAGILKAKFKSFGEEADQFLAEHYKSVGSETAEQKTNLLLITLGKGRHFYGTEDDKEVELGCLEHEFLRRAGKTTLELA